jgi:hypothetical protein
MTRRVMMTYSIDISDYSGYAGETRTTTGNDADVLEGVLTLFTFAIGVVV